MSHLNQTTELESYLFVKCFNEKACLEGTEANKYRNCEEGYDGVLCSQCKDLNWRNYGAFECYPCEMQGSSRGLVYFFKVLCFFAVNYALARMLLRSWSQPNQESLASIRIMLHMIQMFAILSKMDVLKTNY